MNILRNDGTSALEKIILKRQVNAATKYGYMGLVLRVAVIALVLYLILSQMFLITQAKGNEMFPSVKDGDLMIGFRLEKSYVKDDVVVYEINGEMRTGRIVAVGSDVITFSDNGSMMVNGTTQGQDIMYPTYAKEGIEYPFCVPDGCVFVMGDYRTQAEDSRDFGAVPIEDVKCKIITVLRRRSL